MSETLKSIKSRENERDLIERRTIEGRSTYKTNKNFLIYLQINNHTTAFLGGNLDNFKIVTFDWNLNSYIVNPNRVRDIQFLDFVKGDC